MMSREFMRACCLGSMLAALGFLIATRSEAQPGNRFGQRGNEGGEVTLSRPTMAEIENLIRQSENRIIRALSGPASSKPSPVTPMPSPADPAIPTPVTPAPPPSTNPVVPAPPNTPPTIP